jgi:hypothetical protein
MGMLQQLSEFSGDWKSRRPLGLFRVADDCAWRASVNANRECLFISVTGVAPALSASSSRPLYV